MLAANYTKSVVLITVANNRPVYVCLRLDLPAVQGEEYEILKIFSLISDQVFDIEKVFPWYWGLNFVTNTTFCVIVKNPNSIYINTTLRSAIFCRVHPELS